MERKPRAPVRRLMAFFAIATNASARTSRSTLPSKEAAGTADERVLWFDENLHQRALGQFVQRRYTGSRPNQFGNKPELDEVFGFDVAQQFADRAIAATDNLRPKTDAAFFGTVADDFSRPSNAPPQRKGCCGIDLDEVLIRMLATALRRYRSHRASMSFSSACCTPSPDTSRVIDGLSDLREILSIHRYKRCALRLSTS